MIPFSSISVETGGVKAEFVAKAKVGKAEPDFAIRRQLGQNLMACFGLLFQAGARIALRLQRATCRRRQQTK